MFLSHILLPIIKRGHTLRFFKGANKKAGAVISCGSTDLLNGHMSLQEKPLALTDSKPGQILHKIAPCFFLKQ